MSERSFDAIIIPEDTMFGVTLPKDTTNTSIERRYLRLKRVSQIAAHGRSV